MEGVQPTPEMKEIYLKEIAAGSGPKRAAAAAGTTGTKFRALSRPDANNYDPEFARKLETAREQGHDIHKDRLREEIRERAFDRKDPASTKLLTMEAEAYLEEYEHKRVKAHRIGQDGPFQVQAIIPTVTQEALDSMGPEELEALVSQLRKLKELSEGPELRAIEGG